MWQSRVGEGRAVEEGSWREQRQIDSGPAGRVRTRLHRVRWEDIREPSGKEVAL